MVSIIDRPSRNALDIPRSILRGLDRMTTPPTQRIRQMRLELEAEEESRRQQFRQEALELAEALTAVATTLRRNNH